MSDISRILDAAAGSDPRSAADLLPLVYDELRRLAAARMADEAASHTLQPTALVHEAYLRLVGDQQFNGRGHFFAAAAEAMRRILVEAARRRLGPTRGGGGRRVDLDQAESGATDPADRVLDVDGALTRLEAADPLAARLVTLRYFAGLTMAQAADALGIPLRSAERNWTFARTWLHRELTDRPPAGG